MQVTMQVTDQFELFHCQGVMSVIGDKELLSLYGIPWHLQSIWLALT